MVNVLLGLPEEKRAIARMVALGMTRIEIALKLGLSPKTVEYHCRETYRRLGINDVVRLTHLAIMGELVKLGECLCERNAVRT